MILRHQLPGYSPVSLRTLWPVRRGPSMETRLADDLAADAVWLTDSGTSALSLAISASGLGGTGPVAIPAFGCYDLATAAEAARAEVVLYDLDPGTLGPEETSFRRTLERGASRVVVAHLYGLPVDVDLVRGILAESGVALIEDAAQGAGTEWDGVPAGSFGDWSVLSFGRGKGRSAGGGGALLHRGEAGPERDAVERGLGSGDLGVRQLVGWLAQWVLGRPAVYGIPASIPSLRLGETIYHDPHPPRRIATWCRHAVPDALEASPEETACRRRHAEILLRTLESVPDIATVAAPARATPGYLRLPVRARTPQAIARLRALRHLGVMRGYPRPLVELDRFAARVQNRDDAFPGARELAERLYTLPTHSRVAARDLGMLADALGESAS